MRRWDGAYPPLANSTKTVDLLKVEKGPRCVALAAASVNVVGSIHVTTIVCQVRGTHEGPSVRVLFLQVLLRRFCRASLKAQQEIYSGVGRGRRQTSFVSSGSVSLSSSKHS